MSVAAHKFGGPTGVGALLLRRDTACVPLTHGGGQERDVRSGTPDVAGAVAMAAAARIAVGRAGGRQRAAARAAGPADRGRAGRDRRRRGQRLARARLPGNAHFTFRGCEGDSLLMLLDANGIECSTGSACTAGVSQPSHVLLAMGADRGGRAWIIAAVAGAHQRRRRRRCRAAGAARCGGPGPAGRAGERRAGALMRVLAAMSGGVDSSVAAARMVDAGHDVVGVHLALSSAPGTLRTGSRGCCSKEDAGDARRVADVLGIPFYVWDFADRFKEDVIDDFVDSYARGETPNPCVRCNEKIKFSALSARALALGFDAVATGHYARLSRRSAAPRGGRGQGPVLRAGRADRRTVAARRFPDRRHAQAGDPRRRPPSAAWPSPTSRTATTSASSRPVTPRPSSARGSACGADRSSTPRGAVLAEHDGVHGFTIGQRKGLGIAGPGPTDCRAMSPPSTPKPAPCGWARPRISTCGP